MWIKTHSYRPYSVVCDCVILMWIKTHSYRPYSVVCDYVILMWIKTHSYWPYSVVEVFTVPISPLILMWIKTHCYRPYSVVCDYVILMWIKTHSYRPYSVVSDYVTGYWCLSDCRSRGHKFDLCLVPYCAGDESWNNFYGHCPPFRWILQEGLSVTSKSMCMKYFWLTTCSSLPRKKCG